MSASTCKSVCGFREMFHGCVGIGTTSNRRRSALDEPYQATPMVVPTLGCLDPARRLMKEDFYIGRWSKARGLVRSPLRNSCKTEKSHSFRLPQETLKLQKCQKRATRFHAILNYFKPGQSCNVIWWMSVINSERVKRCNFLGLNSVMRSSASRSVPVPDNV